MNQTLERTKTRNFVAHVLTDQSLLNLEMKWRQTLSSGTLVPTLIVVLRDIPDNIFNLSDDVLVAVVTEFAFETSHTVERAKDVLLQIFLISWLKQIVLLI